MSTDEFRLVTAEELAAEGVTALPDKEVVSILDLAADIDLAIDGAAPIDLAIALNANVVAPIDAAVSANLLSDGSTSQALADQGVMVNQTITADAIATGIQDSTIDQSDTTTDGTGAPSAESGDAQPMASLDAVGDSTTAAPSAADGTVVVDSAGNIVGLLDESTGTVVDSDGTIVGTLNEASGLVVDSEGGIVGSLTNLVHGATVVDDDGQVLGELNGVTGEVLDGSGNLVGVLDPVTGEVRDLAGGVLGTVSDLVDGTTVLDSAGTVIGTLDAATGNVVNTAGTVIGTLDPLTGEVVDLAGNLIGTVGQVLDDVTDTVTQLNTGDLLKGDLLSVDVNVDLDADLAAPINGAVAANANVAAPIDAAVAANILSENSEATAIAQQDAIITQSITGSAVATSEQMSDIDQSSVEPPDEDTASTDDPVTVEETPTVAAEDAPVIGDVSAEWASSQTTP